MCCATGILLLKKKWKQTKNPNWDGKFRIVLDRKLFIRFGDVNRFVSICPSLVPCLLAVDCSVRVSRWPATYNLQADYSGQFHLHSTSSFSDRPYYIRERDRSVTSSLRRCDLLLYTRSPRYTRLDSLIDTRSNDHPSFSFTHSSTRCLEKNTHGVSAATWANIFRFK